VTDFLWVGVGAMVGGMARYGISQSLSDLWGRSLPYGTFVVNLTGSFLIGVVMTLLLERVADPVWRLLLVTGFLGGYTTFSSYSFELVTMMQGGRLGWAAVYLLASNLLGVAACLAGTVVARGLLLRGV
jgi:fluoride exporter